MTETSLSGTSFIWSEPQTAISHSSGQYTKVP